MTEYGMVVIICISFLTGAMSNRPSIIGLLRLFLIVVMLLLFIIWQSQNGWPGPFNVPFAAFAFWPVIAGIVGLAAGAHTQPLPETLGLRTRQEKPFPLYLLKIGGKREFVPITHVHMVYQSPHKVDFEGIVLNDDFSVRDANKKEEKELRQIAEAYGPKSNA